MDVCRRTMLLALVLLSAFAFAGTKDLSEFSLRVAIVETHWQQTGYGTSGYGRGNIDDGESLRGFDYTFECSGPFNASQGDSKYMGRWKKPESRLAILTFEIGNTSKSHECELKTSVIDGVYAMKDGHLITYSADQYQQILDTRKKLARALYPPDIDPTHFPLLATILEAQWDKNPSGGMVGTGRGNIKNGTSVIAYEFSGLCLAALQAAPGGSTYKAKWKQEPTELAVLSQSIADSKFHQCDLRTVTRPDFVYVKNSNGTVTQLTQDEFKVWLEKRKAQKQAALASTPETKGTPAPELATGKKAALTNLDVVSMVGSGISTEIILAKMSTSECAFDTSPEGLRQLKLGKVPDAIVLEMIKKGSH